MNPNQRYIIIALYKFSKVDDPKELQQSLKQLCSPLGIKGTLIVAKEGINGTVAGTREAIDSLLSFLKANPFFSDLEHKESIAEEMPFFRLKVRLKNEIVTLGIPTVDPTITAGAYVDPKDWNKLISDPSIIVVDTRNDYEVKIGSFKNAIDPNTKSFREFPDFIKKHLESKKNQRIAMYCTGGIRCEKSTAYLRNLGFNDVYHLKGGILKYLETVPEDQSLWQGECFVFDQRVAVKHGLEEGEHELCFGCRNPISAEDKSSPHYKEGICCPQCHDTRSSEQINRAQQRQKQITLAKKRGQVHMGYVYE